MSLFFLNSFADAWNTIEEFKNAPQYSTNVRTYLHNQLSKSGSGKLSMCRGYNELKQIDATAKLIANNAKMRCTNCINCLIPKTLRDFCYTDGICKVTITVEYRKISRGISSNTAVSYLCDLQDSIFFQEDSEAY